MLMIMSVYFQEDCSIRKESNCFILKSTKAGFFIFSGCGRLEVRKNWRSRGGYSFLQETSRFNDG